ncbi:FG-GAP repeat domain-containing protein [Streptomyces sp. NPDC006477]|uniref:FG-GAP repeat domain-containing protein n=1 Tax=Streptomyces sp. NPDC006477 TaxID=3364747 RepID=UPI0036C43121
MSWLLRRARHLDHDTLSTSYNIASGNLGGSAVGDFVSRDGQGVLHLRKGRGDGTFTAPLRVGTGWNTYGHLVGGSDIAGDGKPDLLGVAWNTGELWLHTSTGKDTAPFLATRTNLGKGWGVYRSITGVGNVAGASSSSLASQRVEVAARKPPLRHHQPRRRPLHAEGPRLDPLVPPPRRRWRRRHPRVPRASPDSHHRQELPMSLRTDSAEPGRHDYDLARLLVWLTVVTSVTGTGPPAGRQVLAVLRR